MQVLFVFSVLSAYLVAYVYFLHPIIIEHVMRVFTKYGELHEFAGCATDRIEDLLVSPAHDVIFRPDTGRKRRNARWPQRPTGVPNW